MSERVCETCQFFRLEQPHDYKRGICRRKSPCRGGDFEDTRWPKVYDDEWCGEHQYGAPSKPKIMFRIGETIATRMDPDGIVEVQTEDESA
jgi:hypothetical protein